MIRGPYFLPTSNPTLSPETAATKTRRHEDDDVEMPAAGKETTKHDGGFARQDEAEEHRGLPEHQREDDRVRGRRRQGLDGIGDRLHPDTLAVSTWSWVCRAALPTRPIESLNSLCPIEKGRELTAKGPGNRASSDKLAPMRVSAKSDYALRALIEIASRDDGAPVSAEELGRLQDIPHGFLQAILADLRRAGIVMSVRGQSGGWRMGRDAAEVTVADIIRAVDGPLVSVYGGLRPEAVSPTTSRQTCLQLVWIAARASLRDVFETVSVAMLATGDLPAEIIKLTKDDEAWKSH